MKKVVGVVLVCCLLCGCGMQEAPKGKTEYRVVLEENTAYLADSYAAVVREGEDATFLLEPALGYELTSVSGGPSVRMEPQEDGTIRLQVEDVEQNGYLSLDATMQEVTLSCDMGDGTSSSITRTANHMGINTPRLDEVEEIPGYALLGWQTTSGDGVPCGSRVSAEDAGRLVPILGKEAQESAFTYEVSGDGVKITGCRTEAGNYDQVLWQGEEMQVLVLPSYIQGKPVYGIASGAISGVRCDAVVLPRFVKKVEKDAVTDSIFTTLFLYDSTEQVSDHAFDGVAGLSTLYVEAAMAPRYSGTYFDTFPDKFGHLLAQQGQKKLVLFSGSSTRFGYDSKMLQEAFPNRTVVNMGVFAYANAYPELLLMLSAMEAGDILLDAPEFDAARSQFATTNLLEWQHFAMCEGDYGMLARLDLQELGGVFSAYNAYQSRRIAMEPRSYDMSAADYDENGHPVATPSYNRQGDYVLYRPNTEDEEPIFDLPVAYTVEALPYETFLKPYNELCKRFSDRDIAVYVTFAPRNRLAISEESTEAKRLELQQYLESHLGATVISDVEESLYDGRYFYETDNHLSTEGVAIRSRQVIEDLKPYDE